MPPAALEVLIRWRPSATTCQNICHWHMQLAVQYTVLHGCLLGTRRLQPNASIERDVAARWVTAMEVVIFCSNPTDGNRANYLLLQDFALITLVSAGLNIPKSQMKPSPTGSTSSTLFPGSILDNLPRLCWTE